METGVIDLESVENSLVRAGLSYWRRLKGGRAFPSRQQIVPADIAGLLRNIILVKVLDGGEDYEFRIVGDAHVQMSGFNMQGSYMHDLKRISPGFAAALQKLYARVLETRQPYALRGVMDRPGHTPMASESVLLPMGQEDASVDHILVFSVYIPKGAPRERAAG